MAAATVGSAEGRRARRSAAEAPWVRYQRGAMAESATAVDEILVGLGDGVTRMRRK
ncbi:hypothetical protein [Streptomyces sp. NPDC127039]|uniref:hypothetical protein n=1 Tax=Streptomyces sp. NPDC127039 TaxID=3347115 RepID=UPI00364F0654